MNKLELITHPAIQTLVEVKWNLFGKKTCVYNVIKNLLYAIIWSVLGISIPRSGNYYLPLKKHAWRMVFEIIGILMTLYFMITVRTPLSFSISSVHIIVKTSNFYFQRDRNRKIAPNVAKLLHFLYHQCIKNICSGKFHKSQTNISEKRFFLVILKSYSLQLY